MIEHQHNWETFETFDFSSIIAAEDQQLAMTDIRNVIAEGKYFTNSPKYQTNINIFNHPGDHWIKFRMSFMMSCFMYLKGEVKIKQVQSWSFMTSSATVENRESLWHNHQCDGERTLSGIYYLHIPNDADLNTSGTEFALDGVDQPARWTSPVKEFSWLIYPGKTWHRPCPPQSSQDRFIIAADMIF